MWPFFRGFICFINFSACLPLAFLIEAIAEVWINTISSAVVHIHEELPLVDAVGAIRDGVDGWLYLRRWALLLTCCAHLFFRNERPTSASFRKSEKWKLYDYMYYIHDMICMKWDMNIMT